VTVDLGEAEDDGMAALKHVRGLIATNDAPV
jgi:hypothetical protein